MENRRHGRWLLALALAVPLHALACKPVNSYLRPSNYELVKTTERIVLARALRFEAECRTVFALLEPIKGELPASEFDLEGCALPDDDAEAPDAAVDFRAARSSGGACTSMSYEQGQPYLLFLAHDEGEWQVTGPAFTRVNEPVSGKDDPWVEAVARYAAIASLQDYEEEKSALRALQAQAESADDRGLRLLAADIAEHFDTVSDHKSYADLRAIHDRTGDDQQRDQVLWAWANRGDLEAKPLFDELLAEGRSDSRVAAYFEKIGDRASLASFAQAYLAAGDSSNDWWARVAPLSALLGLADRRDIDLVLRVYEQATPRHEATMVEEWMAQHPDPRLREALRQRIAGDYVAQHAATFALAACGDDQVARWAIDAVGSEDEGRWVALYALARSPLAASDAAIGALIAHPDDRLVEIVQGYADAVHPQVATRLSELVALTAKSKKLDYWLWRTINALKEAGRLEHADDLLASLPEDAADFDDD